jgi:hypothetical protein
MVVRKEQLGRMKRSGNMDEFGTPPAGSPAKLR